MLLLCGWEVMENVDYKEYGKLVIKDRIKKLKD
jgi:hypothetical protein